MGIIVMILFFFGFQIPICWNFGQLGYPELRDIFVGLWDCMDLSTSFYAFLFLFFSLGFVFPKFGDNNLLYLMNLESAMVGEGF